MKDHMIARFEIKDIGTINIRFRKEFIDTLKIGNVVELMYQNQPMSVCITGYHDVDKSIECKMCEPVDRNTIQKTVPIGSKA